MKAQHIMALALAVALGASGCAPADSNTVGEGSTAEVWSAIVDQARWAQNAHNVQSWRLTTVSSTVLTGGLDPERLLPETDPIARQLVLSLGALTGAARAAAAEAGYHLDAQWIGPEDWTVADDPGATLFRWTIRPTAHRDWETIDGLTAATVKYRLDPAVISTEEADWLEGTYSGDGYAFIVETDTRRVRETLELAIEAFETEMRYEPTLRESYDLTRIGARARRESPYGITLRGNFPRATFWAVDALAALFPQSLEQYADSGIGLFTGALASGRSLIVLTTEDNSPRSWFRSGIALQELWMDVRAQGMELLPLSQGLQEYEQVSGYYEQLHELWATEGGTVQMIMHVGTPRGRMGRSPRLPVDAILSSGE